MRRTVRALMLLMLCVVVATGAFAGGESEQGAPTQDAMVLRFGSVNPPSHPFVRGANRFAELVAEKSEGRITVDIYDSGQLGSVQDHIQNTQTGALDMTMMQPGSMVDLGYTDLNVVSLPFIFRDKEHGWAFVASDLGVSMLDGMGEAGTRMVGVGYYVESPRNMFFRDEPVTNLDDMQGLRVRVQIIDLFVDMMEALGASATPIEWAELYSALQTGVVDAAENPYTGYYNNRLFEVAPYYTLTGHEGSPVVTAMSEITWNRLSPSDQQLIRDAWTESGYYFREILEESEQQIIADLEAAGVEISELEDRERWIEAMEPVYEKYGAGLESLIREIEGM